MADFLKDFPESSKRLTCRMPFTGYEMFLLIAEGQRQSKQRSPHGVQ